MPETNVNHRQMLAKVPIFSGLTENELAFLVQRAVPRHCAPGEIVFGKENPVWACTWWNRVMSAFSKALLVGANTR
jgi:hypothetical protein